MASGNISASSKFLSVQAARGAAALLVAFFHGQHVVKQSLGLDNLPFGGIFEFGHAGVEFFFVLSGFIIFYVHQADLDTPRNLPEFLWKRASRIYPVFWFVMIFYVGKSIVAGNFEWGYFLKTMFLLPQPPYPLLGQSWTLVHEQLFYVMFALAVVNVRLACVLVAFWLAVFAFMPFSGLDESGAARDTVVTIWSAYNFLFIIGIFVAWLSRRARIPAPRALAVVGVVAFLATGMVDNHRGFVGEMATGTLLYGVSSGLLLLGLVAAEARGALRVGRWANWMGDLSYPLYLIHGAAISVTSVVFLKLGWGGSGALLLVASVAIACVAAHLVNRLVERPVARILRRTWTRWQVAAQAPGNLRTERP